MRLAPLDWMVMAAYGVVVLAVGMFFVRRAGEDTTEYFLAGRTLPWWVLGTSMVATTFSTDTPNLVTDIVRTGGVSGNWVWWAYCITGMLTVFFYARLWRRSGVVTDMEFYELRYSGRPAAFLRAFRALYLGFFFNVMIMATVTLAATKIGGVLLGVSPVTVVLVAGTVTLLYSATSGLWGVVATDLLLFVLAMAGSVAAAVYAVGHPQVGGLGGLMNHPALEGRLSFLPDFSDWSTAAAVFVIPIAVQWWSTWYPGSEPGGGGYAAQRMLAARTEEESLKSVLWFNVAHYGLRPWPWILVALASLVVYPTLQDIQAAFPGLDPSILGHDLAYPAMLVFLPAGLLGLVVASLAAAYMSTISTHLNWGASYVVQDAYRRFLAPGRDDRHYVRVARITTVLLTVVMGYVALRLTNALQAFQILLQIGAGTGLVFILRWFWWRINAWSEISAMVISFAVAVWFTGGPGRIALSLGGLLGGSLTFTWPTPDWSASTQLVVGVAITTVGWIVVTFLTPPDRMERLRDFRARIRPLGPGWGPVPLDPGDAAGAPPGGSLSASALAWLLGCVAVYAALFGTGFLLYGRTVLGGALLAVAALGAGAIVRLNPARVGG
ncbi:MAG: sodium:solute symporter family protein [Longimicrobiales bacterium]|nr:sodium:solute symporter family protein [Longimicrobiales bacterium]